MLTAILVLSILTLLANMAIVLLLAAFFACWWFRKPTTIDPALGQRLAAEFVKALPMRAGPAPKAQPVPAPTPE